MQAAMKHFKQQSPNTVGVINISFGTMPMLENFHEAVIDVSSR